MVINGWEIIRDGRGWWAVSGATWIGPYTRKEPAQTYAQMYKAPKSAPQRKQKAVTIKQSTDTPDD